jgi:hypothetical protein
MAHIVQVLWDLGMFCFSYQLILFESLKQIIFQSNSLFKIHGLTHQFLNTKMQTWVCAMDDIIIHPSANFAPNWNPLGRNAYLLFLSSHSGCVHRSSETSLRRGPLGSQVKIICPSVKETRMYRSMCSSEGTVVLLQFESHATFTNSYNLGKTSQELIWCT